MKYLVETQAESDEGIWKPLNIAILGKYAQTVSDSLSLFDENEVSKYYIDWKARIIVKVTAIE